VAISLFDFITAMAPATIGDAMEVPLKIANPEGGKELVISSPIARSDKKTCTVGKRADLILLVYAANADDVTNTSRHAD